MSGVNRFSLRLLSAPEAHKLPWRMALPARGKPNAHVIGGGQTTQCSDILTVIHRPKNRLIASTSSIVSG